MTSYSNNSSRQSSYFDNQGGNNRDRSYNNRDGGSRSNNNRGGRQQRQAPDHSQLPLEQGVICSLKESFGFIYCADRPEEVFFHYSESLQPVDSLQLDAEVEFRIGTRNDKLNAYQVRILEPGSIAWETENEPGKLFRGLVDRPTRFERGQTLDGTIRLLDDQRDGKDVAAIVSDGPELYFRQNDYQPTQQHDEPEPLNGEDAKIISDGRRGQPNRLLKGDLVEFSIVTDRRSKNQFARSISLILSERDRVRHEQETKMLAEATEEVGVVTSLKGEYGFLLSNKRREEIYFHYSTIDMDDTERALGDGDLVLKEGQEMKFLVVNEANGGGEPHGRRRLSARRVSLKPKGSVKFHDAVACGVTGIVVLCPQPADAGHSLEAKGKVLLHEPIEDNDLTGNSRLITEVYLSARDSPGGTYSFRGGSSAATWIQLGDTVLFDVVSDYVDGACHAAPTKHLIRNPTPFELEEEGDTEHPIDRRIRLVSLSLMARSEGIVHTVKDAYGFIHYNERPVDAHFKLYQVLPDVLQNDLRRHMGLTNVDKHGRQLGLQVGAEVMFDISVHGRIQGALPGRHHKNQAAQERENLKAQRILFLPAGTVQQSKTLGAKLRGTISKKDKTQLYAGMVDLDMEVLPMTMEERYPLVAKMVDEFVASPVQTALIYHDILSAKEDEVVMNMIEFNAKGLLSVTHIPVPGETSYPGKLSIRKLSEEERQELAKHDGGYETPPKLADASTDGATSDDDGQVISTPGTADKRRKKKWTKTRKPVSSIRFDRASFCDELKNDAPLAVNDIVELDVVQSRRTGMVTVENMRIVERITPAAAMAQDGGSAEGLGIVKEIVTARNFGFITVLDEAASKRESIFFQLSSVVSSSTNYSIRKGDEVSFKVTTERNGKRVAQNVKVLPKGTIPNLADKNACQGLVLLEPSHNGIKKQPVRQRSSSHPATIDKPSRWSTVDLSLPEAPQGCDAAMGCILLLRDPTQMFDNLANNGQSNEDAAALEVAPSAMSAEAAGVNVTLKHLSYKIGAIAIHGIGSTDETSAPRRGDLVSFIKARDSIGLGARDIRIVTKGAAILLRGRLESIHLGESVDEGTAKFIAMNNEETLYDVKLSEVLGCDLSSLKEKESVEGVLYDGQLYGICRTCDVYLESKFGSNNKERPKLNLTVKKDRAGKIMAQSHMAKGPDGSCGFVTGWTSRMSKFAELASEADVL
ncbi:hypothetical protein MPSEU_000313200 [Mayamaea pseudoterrestris]|nr:hypothetical protein MPSEU_000313200 [Mayamaea pseudoterrestris]